MTQPNLVDERIAASSYSRPSAGLSRNERPVVFVACANDRVTGVRYLRNLASELRAIRAALAPLTTNEQWELVERTNATLDDILDVFQSEIYRDRIAVFHFAGHADGYRLLLETERGVLSTALGKGLSAFLGRQRGLQLVVLNGCATEDQAQSLLAAGVHSVIATSSEIVDKVARVFATRLYRGLATGADLRRAFDESAAAIRSTPATRRHLAVSRQGGIRRQDAPWGLFPDDVESSSWTLGDIAGNPLLGMLKPKPVDLPDSPFLNLLPFESEHWELFFGRGRDIRKLYQALVDPRSDPIQLLCGQTGVGKSSILAAGLLPYLGARENQDVIYRRRHESLGLLATLANALDCEPACIADAWRKREGQSRVLTVVLDQVEEAFTRQQSTEGEAELRALCTQLRSLFLNPKSRPRGKLLLAFRKDHLAEINERFIESQLPRTGRFLERLDRAGIIEAITGPSREQRLRDKYQLIIEPRLADIIADDLQEDSGSNIAPVLQILLWQMWARVERQDMIPRVFDRDTYQELKGKGLLLSDFLDQQIAALHEWRPDLVDSGFVWDFLCGHTTEYGGRTRTADELERDYPHQQAWRALRDHSVSLHLLVESQRQSREESSTARSARLAHDTLAPLVRQRFAQSFAEGQKARRILENRAADWSGGRAGDVLDEADLAQVERGALGMRAWSSDEQRLVEASREARADRQRRRKRLQLVFIAGAATILAVSGVAAIQYAGRERQRRIALASSLVTQAEASLGTGKLLTQSVLLGAESMRRLIELKQPTLDADRALRAALALAVPGDSALRLGSHVSAAALSDRANMVALAGADSVRVGDIDARSQTRAFHSAKSYLVALSPDGRRVAAAGSDNTIELLNVATGERVALLSLKQPVQGMAWSAATGSLAVLLSGSATVELWRDVDGTVTKKFPHSGVVTQIAMSGDGDHLATTVNSTLTVWATNGAESRAVQLPNGLTHVVFDPSGRCVIAASGPKGQAWIWDVSKRAIVSQLSTVSDVVEVSADPTCTRVAFGTTTGDVQIIDWRTDRAVTGMKHDARIATLSFSTDGTRIVSASGDHTARVWRVSDGTELARMVHDAGVVCARFLDDSTVLAASEDGQVKIWHLRSSAYRWRRELGEPIVSTQVSPDGGTIASGTQYGAVRLSSLSGAWRDTIFNYGAPITALHFLPDSKTLIVAGVDGVIRLDLTTRTPTALWKGVVTSLSVDRSGDLAMGRGDGSVVLAWRSHRDSIVAGSRTNDQVRAIAWSRDGHLLVWAHQRSIRLQRIGESAKLLDTALASQVNALDFDPAGRAFAMALEDSTVEIHGLPNGQRIMTLRHPRGVTMAVYSPDGAYLATSGRDGVARVWAVTSGQEVSRIVQKDEVESVAFSDDGALLVTGTRDGAVTVWRWRPGDLRAAACAFAGRARLSSEEWRRFAGESKASPTCESQSK